LKSLGLPGRFSLVSDRLMGKTPGGRSIDPTKRLWKIRLKTMKLLVIIVLFICGAMICLLYLPERMFELIASVRNIEISVYDLQEVDGGKHKVLYTVLLAFVCICTKALRILRDNYLTLVIAFVSVFPGYFLGMLINSYMFQVSHDGIISVDAKRCLTYWINLPVIILILYLLKFLFQTFKKKYEGAVAM